MASTPEILLGPEPGAADRASEEWPFQIALVWIRDLTVDGRYQRPVQEQFVTRMADSFDETLVGVIDVSSATSAILDGQQRYEAMRRVGKTTCWAALYDGLALEDEAGFFYRKNRDRKSMKAWYAFRARMVAGDRDALAINEAAERLGYSFGEASDDRDVIGAVRACEWAWGYTSEHRPECMTAALSTIKRLWWGRTRSLDAGLILGFGRFWQRYSDEEVDRAVLNGALREVGSPTNMLGLGRERVFGTSEKTLPFGTALAIVEAYNRAKRGTARGAVFEGRLDPGALRL